MNLSLYFWRSCWFSVSCFTSFFIEYLSCYLCSHKKSLWHIPSRCFPLSYGAPCFLVLEIFLWEPFLHIFGRQSTAQFVLFLVYLLQYDPQILHKNNTLVPYLSYQWNGCYIFQHAFFLHMLASVFCVLTCFEFIASVAELSNHVLDILLGDVIFVHH